MIEVTSYLRKSPDQFVDVLLASEFGGDSDYIEGAIDLRINGVVVVDMSMWDYVDQLWSYIITMMLELRTAQEAKTYFPDQPVELKFSRVGGRRVLVSCDPGDGRRAAAVELVDFVQEMSNSAMNFFQALSKLIPENSVAYALQLARIEELRANHYSPFRG